MKLIPLSQGKFAQVDDEDFEYLNQWKWCAHKNKNVFYAQRNVLIDGKRKTQLMHVLIMGNNPTRLQIDHIDGIGLNNQKNNLMFCTNQENCMKQHKQNKKCSSIYKGVHWCKSKLKWQSYIKVNFKQIHLGFFAIEEDAARAYDFAAIKYFKNFAHLNFPL